MYSKFKKDPQILAKLKDIVKDSFSIREVLLKLGLAPFGANYSGFKSACKRLNISTEHFTGMGHLKGKTHNWNKPKSLSEICIEGSTYNRVHLKSRLIKTGLLVNKCHICSLTTWLDKHIVLHLDHINGINDDHRLENLRLLCPNCHSQTDTYCGKKNKK